MCRWNDRGFTLIELMLAIAVAAVLMALGVPAMTTWLGNVAIRTNTEAISSGIQLARAEAVRRNTPVRVVLNGAGTSWTISQVNDGSVIQEHGAEGRADTMNVSFCPSGGRTFTFNSLGTLTDITPVTQISVTSNALSPTQARRMCVIVSVGGIARMCDPQRPVTVPPDPQGCPAIPEICQYPPAACP